MSTFAQTPVLHSRGQLLTELQQRRQSGGRVALVMTMGALHEGHLDLVREAHRKAEVVVVSIFVNPLQFAPGEDLDKYPRTLDADTEMVAGLGPALIYAPAPEEVYPPTAGSPAGEPAVRLDPGPIGSILEGKTRPTHFAGVLQVVAKVINLVQPDYALFGEKDAQQLHLVRQMVQDLDMPVEIVPVPIRREADGLAMSSRNRYLNPEQRQVATTLFNSLQAGQKTALNGGTAPEIKAAATAVIESQPQVKLDYLELVDAQSFQPLETTKTSGAANGTRPARLLIAAWVGQTRLIDNLLMQVNKV